MTAIIPEALAQAADRVRQRAESVRQSQIAFLGDLIRIKS